MKPLALLAILLTFLVGTALHVEPSDAQVYKKRNADGSITYTDKPLEGAEQVEIEQAPVTEFAKPAVATQPDEPEVSATGGDSAAEAEAIPTEFSVAITSPEQQQPIRANNGQFDVLWQSDPERLPEGYVYELFVDGQPAWRGSDSNQVTLAEISRGERRIYVRIVDAQGNQVARSDTVVVFVLRVAINGAGAGSGGNGGGA